MATKIKHRTEDQVRDSAKIILGFDAVETKIQQGTGQITTFNQLGFKGINDKPDGWYLPDDHNMPAIILETKFVIKLPVQADGTPDYDYMSNFIRRIKEQSSHTLETLQSVKAC